MSGAVRSKGERGTVAFLFTDIEGSTRLVERLGEAYADVLREQREIMRGSFARWGGSEIDTQGDSFFVVFGRASDAVSCAHDAQVALAGHSWPANESVKVRMAVHAGEALAEGGGYVGMEVHRGARIMAAGHGGQVLLSQAAAVLVRDQLTEGTALVDLGEHELKDVPQAERIFQLVHPKLQTAFPPLRTLGRRHNLPAPPSTFVGRKHELASITRELASHSTRLLTLLGPGGTGKTRLALQAAEALIPRFDDGVFLVDLASATEAETALALIAHSIGVEPTREEPVLEQLTQHLGAARCLLVLDNFEQVSSAAPSIARLLEGCPALRLLITSREPLHVRAEQVFAVQPLSLPSGDTGRAAPDLTRFEAIQLFVERARAVQPDFRLTDDNAAAVLDICRRVDGLPLAIELATARLNLFSPEALRDRLSSRLAVLRGGARDLPARQQTLRATIEWSYELLEGPERNLFELLSVFAGAEYDDVEALVTALGATFGLALDPLDGIASLLDKSLVLRSVGPTGPRLTMLETIREYAAERLREDSTKMQAARRAHAERFASIAPSLNREHLGRRELDNLEAAWRYWVEQRDIGRLNQIEPVLRRTLEERGLYQAAIGQATDLLEVLSAAPPSPVIRAQRAEVAERRVRTMMAISGFTEEVEDAYISTVEFLESEQADQTADHLFPVLRALASMYVFRMKFDKAAQVGARMIALGEAEGDGDIRAAGHLFVGVTAGFAGDLSAGIQNLDQAIAWYDAHPPKIRPGQVGAHPAVVAQMTAGLTLWLAGYPDRALEAARRGLEVAEGIAHPFSVAHAHYHAGFLRLWRREPEAARLHALSILSAIEDHELPIWRALGMCLLGAANAGLGLVAEGVQQIDSGLEMYRGIRTPPVFWPFLRAMEAATYARAGRIAEAITLIDESIAIVGDQLPQFSLLKGELLLAAPEHEAHRIAESYIRRAFDMSAAAQARMPQLQASAALRRLGLRRGTDEGQIELRDTYETFTEGFDTPDLLEARELMAHNGASNRRP